jgi:hypothetical protein
MTVLLLIIMIVSPIALLAWSVRALRAWAGAWRLVPIGPLGLLAAAGITMAVGIREDNIAHGPWVAFCFGLVVLASLVAYIASELHQASERRADTSTAPLDER